jgi:hypothetical protein
VIVASLVPGMAAESNNLVALERARAIARERVGDGYANDLLDADELDRRLDALEHAATASEIARLVDDLAAPIAVADALGDDSVALVPIDSVALTGSIHALFAETKRAGPWTPARATAVSAVFASVRLDLREALLAAGVTAFEVNVVFGELEVVVPPGLAVDVECNAMFGEIDQDESLAGAPPTSSARIRITGRVWFGSVTIREQLVGESKSEARKRRKAERKRLAGGGRRKMIGPA